MFRLLQNNILRFIGLFGIQILILNNIPLFGFCIPYMYILFILMLPFEINKTILVLFGFGAGLLIDFSFNSPGVHASATLLVAFIRPYILNKMSPRQGYDINSQPMMAYYGFKWFLKYAAITVLIHHLVIFYNLSLSFEDSFFLFIRAVINFTVTLVLILLSQHFIFRK